MTIQLVIRSPDQALDEGYLLSFSNQDDYWNSLLSGEPHKDILSVGFKVFPGGFVIDGFADDEQEEAYETYIRILH